MSREALSVRVRRLLDPLDRVTLHPLAQLAALIELRVEVAHAAAAV